MIEGNDGDDEEKIAYELVKSVSGDCLRFILNKVEANDSLYADVSSFRGRCLVELKLESVSVKQ